ncbi:MAG TPA: hypothetical protein VGD21_12960 [Lysobacter sp.]
MADAKTIAATIREFATGTVEWRVQDPVEKCYCISFDHRSSINPAREAREWLSDHKARHPNSMHAGYEVAEVRWFSRLERAALEAADTLDPAGVGALDALKRDVDAWISIGELPPDAGVALGEAMDERSLFERVHLGGVKKLARRNEHGEYVAPSINDAWAGWQSARAAGVNASDKPVTGA